MQTAEICVLTRNAVRDLVTSRIRARLGDDLASCQRKAPRWPFAGTVELWVPQADGQEYTLATCLNLCEDGMGLRCEQELSPGLELDLAVHQPEVTFHGRGVIRHCTPSEGGEYLIGVEFLFDEEPRHSALARAIGS